MCVVSPISIGLFVSAIGFGGVVGSYSDTLSVSIDGETRQTASIEGHWVLIMIMGLVTAVIGGLLL